MYITFFLTTNREVFEYELKVKLNLSNIGVKSEQDINGYFK